MVTFKNKATERFYFQALNMIPGMQRSENRIKLENMLPDITLPDIPLINKEFYEQSLEIFDCGFITITWNVDKLLSYTPTQMDFEMHSVRQLLMLMDYNSQQVKDVEWDISHGILSKHKKDYIVIAILPGFRDPVIIDGNHRVLERKRELDYQFKCFFLADERVLDFLEPNSRRLIEAIYFIDSVANKE